MRLHHRGRRHRLRSGHDRSRRGSTPDSPTWHALFDKTKVGDGKFKDLSETQFPSFPVADASKYILDLYTTVSESHPNAFPPVTTGPLATLAEDLGNISGDGRRRYYPMLEDMARTVEGPKGRSWRYLDRDDFPVTPEGNRDPLLVFTEAQRFHDRPGARELSAQNPPPPPPEPPKVDFHGFVAFCGDYPNLMRRLGLAFDVLLEQPPGMKEDGRIRLEVRESPAEWMFAEAARPWTNYEIEDRRFLARRTIAKATSSTGCCGSSGSTGSRSTRSMSTAVRSRPSTSPPTCSGSMHT